VEKKVTGIVNFTPKVRKEERSGQRRETGWQAELQDLINKHGGQRVDGRVASYRTRAITAEALFTAFNTLHNELGMTPRPHNLKEENVRKLVHHWYYVRKKQVNTIKTELSILRKFARWIRKPNMVKPLEAYLPDVNPKALVVRAAASKSKSWTANGINVEEKIQQAFLLNERFGLILLVQLTYGLRMKEALLLRPWKAHHHDGLMVYPNAGPKGSRPRKIPFLIPEQFVVMDKVIKDRIRKDQSLAWEKTRRGGIATLEYCYGNYYAYCREIGITKKDADVVGHGLRAEFCVNMARVKGFDPVTEEYTGENPPYDELMARVAEVSELVGHSRTQVMASYFGAFKRDKDNDVEYVGAGRRFARKGGDDQNYASTSAKRIAPPKASDGAPTQPEASEMASKDTDSAASSPVPHYGAARREWPTIASIVARFKAPEYRGRGRVTTDRKGDGAAADSRGAGDASQRPEDRQMKLQFPLAVVARKPGGSDRS
jgi:hypothetical protein